MAIFFGVLAISAGAHKSKFVENRMWITGRCLCPSLLSEHWHANLLNGNACVESEPT